MSGDACNYTHEWQLLALNIVILLHFLFFISLMLHSMLFCSSQKLSMTCNWISKIYVSLQLLMQNRRRKWHFPLNSWNSINWTSPFPLNIRNAINWAGAFSKAFSSSEALILVLSKNACLYDNISNSFQSKTLYIVLIFKWSCLDTNLWICNLCICQKTCQQNTNIW